MNATELRAKVASSCSLKRREVDEVLTTLTHVICDELSKTGTPCVHLFGLGVLRTKDVKPRVYYAVQRGILAKTNGRRKVAFTAYTDLTDAIARAAA